MGNHCPIKSIQAFALCRTSPLNGTGHRSRQLTNGGSGSVNRSFAIGVYLCHLLRQKKTVINQIQRKTTRLHKILLQIHFTVMSDINLLKCS